MNLVEVKHCCFGCSVEARKKGCLYYLRSSMFSVNISIQHFLPLQDRQVCRHIVEASEVRLPLSFGIGIRRSGKTSL